MSLRAWNFGAGPAVLPEEVLEQIKSDLPVYSNSGTVTWSWSAAYEDGSVVQYQIQVGTTPGSSDVFEGVLSTSQDGFESRPGYGRSKRLGMPWWDVGQSGILLQRSRFFKTRVGPKGPRRPL